MAEKEPQDGVMAEELRLRKPRDMDDQSMLSSLETFYIDNDDMTDDQSLFSQCQTHLSAINASTELQQVIKDEMSNQAKLEQLISQKMAGKAKRLRHQSAGLPHAPEWLTSSLNDMANLVNQQAQAHHVFTSTLNSQCEAIQLSLDGHLDMMNRIHGQVKELEELGTPVGISGNSSPFSRLSAKEKSSDIIIPDKMSFTNACVYFENIRRKRMGLHNKISFLHAQLKATERQRLKSEAAIANLTSGDRDGMGKWNVHQKIQDFQGQREYFMARKKQVEEEMGKIDSQLNLFDFKHKDDLLQVLDVFAQHRVKCDESLRKSFHILRAISLRELSAELADEVSETQNALKHVRSKQKQGRSSELDFQHKEESSTGTTNMNANIDRAIENRQKIELANYMQENKRNSHHAKRKSPSSRKRKQEYQEPKSLKPNDIEILAKPLVHVKSASRSRSSPAKQSSSQNFQEPIRDRIPHIAETKGSQNDDTTISVKPKVKQQGAKVTMHDKPRPTPKRLGNITPQSLTQSESGLKVEKDMSHNQSPLQYQSKEMLSCSKSSPYDDAKPDGFIPSEQGSKEENELTTPPQAILNEESDFQINNKLSETSKYTIQQIKQEQAAQYQEAMKIQSQEHQLKQYQKQKHNQYQEQQKQLLKNQENSQDAYIETDADQDSMHTPPQSNNKSSESSQNRSQETATASLQANKPKENSGLAINKTSTPIQRPVSKFDLDSPFPSKDSYGISSTTNFRNPFIQNAWDRSNGFSNNSRWFDYSKRSSQGHNSHSKMPYNYSQTRHRLSPSYNSLWAQNFNSSKSPDPDLYLEKNTNPFHDRNTAQNIQYTDHSQIAKPEEAILVHLKGKQSNVTMNIKKAAAQGKSTNPFSKFASSAAAFDEKLDALDKEGKEETKRRDRPRDISRSRNKSPANSALESEHQAVRSNQVSFRNTDTIIVSDSNDQRAELGGTYGRNTIENVETDDLRAGRLIERYTRTQFSRLSRNYNNSKEKCLCDTEETKFMGEDILDFENSDFDCLQRCLFLNKQIERFHTENIQTCSERRQTQEHCSNHELMKIDNADVKTEESTQKASSNLQTNNDIEDENNEKQETQRNKFFRKAKHKLSQYERDKRWLVAAGSDSEASFLQSPKQFHFDKEEQGEKMSPEEMSNSDLNESMLENLLSQPETDSSDGAQEAKPGYNKIVNQDEQFFTSDLAVDANNNNEFEEIKLPKSNSKNKKRVSFRIDETNCDKPASVSCLVGPHVTPISQCQDNVKQLWSKNSLRLKNDREEKSMSVKKKRHINNGYQIQISDFDFHVKQRVRRFARVKEIEKRKGITLPSDYYFSSNSRNHSTRFPILHLKKTT